MFDTELYQQVLGLTAPWKVTDVRLDVESTEIHVHVEQAFRLRARILGAGEHEAPGANLVGILAGDMGHGVDQVRVTHEFSIS
jgi:hypothetical protein